MSLNLLRKSLTHRENLKRKKLKRKGEQKKNGIN